MNLTAFDLATATGVCDGPVGGKPRLFSWYLRDGGDRDGQKFEKLYDFLCRYFTKESCDGVVYEQPLPIGMLTAAAGKKDKRIMVSDANFNFSRALIGVLKLACEKNAKSYEGLSVQDARQAVLGWRINRTKEPTKKRVVREATSLLKLDADNDNEVDAGVLWYYACARANPRAALQMTPLFGGALR